jgi:DNA repair exonuclease SbcCD nuclease subunit
LKLAIISDTHAGIRNSSEIFINYQRRFYEEVFFPYLRENNISTILHLGDYYENRTSINFKALKANREHFLDKLREYKIHMDIIPGNHDVAYKSTNELCSLKELLGHYMNEVNIIMKPRVMDYDGLRIALVPWINRENEADSISFIKNCKADILGAHLEITGFDMYKGMPCQDGMDPKIFSRFEMVLSGHFHTKSTRGNIHYLGAQMEFFWNDMDDRKYFHVLDTETRELTPVQNPIRMFERIYYNDENQMRFDYEKFDNKFVHVVVQHKANHKYFNEIIDKIQQRDIHQLKISENLSEFVGESVADSDISVQDTQTLLGSYVDAVDTELDKTKIKTRLMNLLNESQSMEIM